MSKYRSLWNDEEYLTDEGKEFLLKVEKAIHPLIRELFQQDISLLGVKEIIGNAAAMEIAKHRVKRREGFK